MMMSAPFSDLIALLYNITFMDLIEFYQNHTFAQTFHCLSLLKAQVMSVLYLPH